MFMFIFTYIANMFTWNTTVNTLKDIIMLYGTVDSNHSLHKHSFTTVSFRLFKGKLSIKVHNTLDFSAKTVKTCMCSLHVSDNFFKQNAKAIKELHDMTDFNNIPMQLFKLYCLSTSMVNNKFTANDEDKSEDVRGRTVYINCMFIDNDVYTCRLMKDHFKLLSTVQQLYNTNESLKSKLRLAGDEVYDLNEDLKYTKMSYDKIIKELKDTHAKELHEYKSSSTSSATATVNTLIKDYEDKIHKLNLKYNEALKTQKDKYADVIKSIVTSVDDYVMGRCAILKLPDVHIPSLQSIVYNVNHKKLPNTPKLTVPPRPPSPPMQQLQLPMTQLSKAWTSLDL